MSTVVKIGRVENLYILGEQHAAGAEPEKLVDIGYGEAAGLPESPVVDEGPQTPHEPTRKDQESIEGFRARLIDDVYAHCVPPGYPRRPPRQRNI